MKKFFSLAITVPILSFILQSCNPWTSIALKNENIDEDIKSQIHALNDQLIEGITTNNPSLINEITSDNFKKSGEETNNFLKRINGLINTDSYSLLDEYYIKSTTT